MTLSVRVTAAPLSLCAAVTTSIHSDSASMSPARSLGSDQLHGSPRRSGDFGCVTGLGAAGVGAIAEDRSNFGTALIFLLLPETLVIFGLLIAFILNGRL